MEFLHFFFFKSHFCLAGSEAGWIHSPNNNMQPCQPNIQGKYALIKEKIKFAKSYIKKGFLTYEEMRKNFPIYEEAVSHLQYDFATAPF